MPRILFVLFIETGEFPREGICSGNETAQGIEAVSFCPVTGWWTKDTGNMWKSLVGFPYVPHKARFFAAVWAGAAKNAPKYPNI
jgi:hypothetical protein